MRQQSGRSVRSAVAGVVLLAGLAGCTPLPSAGPGAPTDVLDDPAATSAVEAAPPSSALAALAAVDVKGRAPRTGYARDEFGSGWVDTDRNGCDTRNDVLARDLVDETFAPGTHDCVVRTGTLDDPYSGTTIAFVRGEGTSDDVQIDHVVALSDAWQKGAQGWTAERRVAFANDPLNLLAVDGSLNTQKGDGDAATWLPPNRSYRCAYVARQVAVKISYGLWMTGAEKNAAATVLSTCPGEPLPGGVRADVPAPSSPPEDGYASCDAARAAGAAPLREGQPGYRPELDGDGDGVACE
ncbi:GmrSD restriction endonuclease domain-containing protein [Geodermatophilus sp. URMC 64]